MIATETLQERQEDKDFRREQDVKELKNQWKAYSPSKQVSFIKQHPEIAEVILTLINGLN